MAIIDRNVNFTDADIHLIFTMLTGQTNGYTSLFKFLNDNWDTVKQRFAEKPNLWTGIVHSATGFFKSREGLDMVEKLYAARQSELGEAPKATETIKQELAWSEKNLPAIEGWLDRHNDAKTLQFDKDALAYWSTALDCPKKEQTTATPPAS